jgi:Rieske Fe-S protein
VTGREETDEAEVPLWREEFPLTSQGEELVARRDFTRYLLAASGVLAAGASGAALWATLQRANTGEPRPIVDVADVPEGTEHLFRYPTEDDPAILVHLPGGELRSFTQKCTHLGCVVFYQPDQDRLFCPCHEGEFDPVSGAPTGGPPDRPLARIDTEVRDGVVWALGMRT